MYMDHVGKAATEIECAIVSAHSEMVVGRLG